MGASINRYNPDYAVPPGWVLQEHIEALGLSQAEFAGLCGFSPEIVSEIISGKGRIEPGTASVLGRETGLDETLWLNMEAAYRYMLSEMGKNEELAEWAQKFPVKELVKRGDISQLSLQADGVARMLSFFDVWSVGAFGEKYGRASVAYRHSPSFKSSRPALAAWLRLGEIEAEQTECPEYDQEAFLVSLQDIRNLTGKAGDEIFEQAKKLCLQSGVVLLFVKPLDKVRLSGAAWWVSSRKPIIQLSARHKTDDHVWYSLFHEAAHILLHSKRQVFIDAIRGKTDCNGEEESEAESEADAWARNFLVPLSDWNKFSATFLGSEGEVRYFAEQQGIATGIVVGRLQREGRLPWNRLNGLKRKLEWADPPAQPAGGG